MNDRRHNRHDLYRPEPRLTPSPHEPPISRSLIVLFVSVLVLGFIYGVLT